MTTRASIPPEARTDMRRFKAFKMMFRRWGHHNGYSSRAEFWWAFLVAMTFLILAIGSIIFLLFLRPEMAVVLTLIISIFMIAFLVSFIALLMRRLADAGFYRFYGLALLLVLVPYDMLTIGGRVFSIGEVLGGGIFVLLMGLCLFPTRVKIIK